MTKEDAIMMGAVRFIKEKLHSEFEERMKVLEADKQELAKVRSENARLREALVFRGYDPDSELKHHEQEAREALRGDITPDKGGE
jgi:hypothetical protein